MRLVNYKDLGVIRYRAAWDYQQTLLSNAVAVKLANRHTPPDVAPTPVQHHLLVCEHPHVYTLGKSGAMAHLLLDETALADKGIEFFKTNRGGDITYHGYGQLVGYPILDLDDFFTDVHRYVRCLEEVIIRTLAAYGLRGGRISGATGVWLYTDTPHPKKICAIGVHLSRWVTMHGFAFNVNPDMQYFNYIVPCGISDKGVVSLAQALGCSPSIDEVKAIVCSQFQEVFECVLR